MKVSVVIPTWNEAGNIAECVWSALQCGAWEVIVSDGGSQDDTLAVVRSLQESRVKSLRSDPGRGAQLRTGANHATGEMLLFLHADNRLPSDALEQLAGAGWPKWGGYRQRIDAKGVRYRMLEWGNALRGRCRSNLFGDQAIFVQREWYDAVGGFAPVSLMEDVMLSAALRKHSSATLLPGPVLIDARRWKQRGVVRQTLLNWRIQRAFRRGASPEDLRRLYDGHGRG